MAKMGVRRRTPRYMGALTMREVGVKEWLRDVLDPAMPGTDGRTLVVKPLAFGGMLLVIVVLAICRYFLGVLDTSDAQGPTVILGLLASLGVLAIAHGPRRLAQVHRGSWFTLAVATGLYLLFWYWGRADAFDGWLLPLLGKTRSEVPLLAFAYFCLNNLLVLLLPALLAGWLYNRSRPSDFGLYGPGNPHPVGARPLWPLYAVALMVVLPFVVQAGTADAFLRYYPMYRKVIAPDGSLPIGTLLLCQALYLSQFAFVEAFFRGYMIFGMERGFGAYGLALMAVPYVTGHFGKPMPEALGAIVAAVLLGWFALKHRSIWLGVALHVGVAITMDTMALMGRGTRITWGL